MKTDTRIRLEIELMETYAEATGLPFTHPKIMDMALNMSQRLENTILSHINQNPRRRLR